MKWEERYELYKELKSAKIDEAYHRKQMQYFRNKINIIKQFARELKCKQ